MNLKETYNRIAEDWNKDHQNDDWWVEGTNAFISYLEPGAEVLDVGCGAGVKSKYLIEHGLKVTGIDFSEKFLQIAKQRAPAAEFLLMDMRDADSLPKDFDAIFAQASLLHIPRAEFSNTLSVLISKLKQDGYVYVAVKGARENGPLEEVKTENDYGYSYDRFFSYYTLDELKSSFGKLGLRVVYDTVQTVGKTNWLQIIGQK